MAKTRTGKNPRLARSIIYSVRSVSTARSKKERKWARDPKRHEYYSCTKKRLVFDTQAEADAKAEELNGDGDTWREQQGYKCWYCPHWHVGRVLKIAPPYHLGQARQRILNEQFYGMGTREIGCLLEENGCHPHGGNRAKARTAIAKRSRAAEKRRNQL